MEDCPKLLRSSVSFQSHPTTIEAFKDLAAEYAELAYNYHDVHITQPPDTTANYADFSKNRKRLGSPGRANPPSLTELAAHPAPPPAASMRAITISAATTTTCSSV